MPKILHKNQLKFIRYLQFKEYLKSKGYRQSAVILDLNIMNANNPFYVEFNEKYPLKSRNYENSI